MDTKRILESILPQGRNKEKLKAQIWKSEGLKQGPYYTTESYVGAKPIKTPKGLITKRLAPNNSIGYDDDHLAESQRSLLEAGQVDQWSEIVKH